MQEHTSRLRIPQTQPHPTSPDRRSPACRCDGAAVVGLGLLLDCRLSQVTHWQAAAASAKRATGALARLVRRHPAALKHLLQERVSSALLHALPYAPPSTQAGWAAVNGVTSYAAHLLSNTWHKDGKYVHGFEIMELAEVPSASEAALKAGLRYLFKCVKGSRCYGQWLQRKPPPATSTRSASRHQEEELLLPATALKAFDHFGCVRLIKAWNCLIYLPSFHSPTDLQSLPHFNVALDRCTFQLPSHILKTFGLPY